MLAGPWEACSAPCGGGTQRRDIVCLQSTASGSSAPVDTSKCSAKGLVAPADTRSCNIDACKTATPVRSHAAGLALSSAGNGGSAQEAAADAPWINVNALGVPLATKATQLHLTSFYLQKLSSSDAAAASALLYGSGAGSAAPSAVAAGNYSASGSQAEAYQSWQPPRTPATWNATAWADCKPHSSDSGNALTTAFAAAGNPVGLRRRNVTCIELANGERAADSSCFPASKPASAEACLLSSTHQLGTAIGSVDGIGTCTAPGAGEACSGAGECIAGQQCACAGGASGAFCQIPASCAVVNARLECCGSGSVSAVTGATKNCVGDDLLLTVDATPERSCRCQCRSISTTAPGLSIACESERLPVLPLHCMPV